MTPDAILIGAVGFALGALTTFALWVPRGGGVQSTPPTTRPQGWRPRPPPSGSGARGPEYFDAEPPPPPKVYPEGQPPRRKPPADYRPVAHINNIRVEDGFIRWTATATVTVPDGVRVRFVDHDGKDVTVYEASKTPSGEG